MVLLQLGDGLDTTPGLREQKVAVPWSTHGTEVVQPGSTTAEYTPGDVGPRRFDMVSLHGTLACEIAKVRSTFPDLAEFRQMTSL
ncbi:hypothetical protein ANO14919_139750 [Xylariales sp. No.14919]|nr:hypothetical protein ANO14919_139750 [Xylariales sp. No.14919]